jgi:AraC family transcriptional regulator, transcriptional activator of pobA
LPEQPIAGHGNPPLLIKMSNSPDKNNMKPLSPIFKQASASLEIHDLTSFVEEHFMDATLAVRFESFLLIYVLEGKGGCWVDLREYPLAGDTVYCIYPGQLIALEKDASMAGNVISFTPEFLCSSKDDIWNLLHSGLFGAQTSCPIPINGEMKAGTMHLLHSMRSEYGCEGKMKHEMLRSLLKMLIILLNRRLFGSGDDEVMRRRDTDQVNTFFELVQKHFITLKKVSDYAELVGIPSSYLNVVVKRVSGFTAKQYIQQQIILEAKRQVRWEGKNLKQIAYHLGFEDTAHFSKFFKNTAGINFSEFKRMHRLY